MVAVSLVELIETRLRELGAHGKPLSIRAAAAKTDGLISHEQLRQIVKGRHRGNYGDTILQGIAVAIDVAPERVYRAAKIPPPQGELVLPPEHVRLTPRQREAVLSVIHAMLETPMENETPQRPGLRAVARKRPQQDR